MFFHQLRATFSKVQSNICFSDPFQPSLWDYNNGTLKTAHVKWSHLLFKLNEDALAQSTLASFKMGILAEQLETFPTDQWLKLRCSTRVRFRQVGDRSSLSFMGEIIRRRRPRSNFTSDSHQLQWLEITCSCVNVGKCSPLSLQQYVNYVSMWNSYVWWCMPAAERTFAPDYWHVSLNVMQKHRCNIQAWRERAEATPFVRVWRTHAIPHICSISDCITEALFAFPDIRKACCYHSNRYFIYKQIFWMNPQWPVNVSPVFSSWRLQGCKWMYGCMYELHLWTFISSCGSWSIVSLLTCVHLVFSLNRKRVSVPELVAVVEL